MKTITYKMFAGILILALSLGNCPSLWAAEFAASSTPGTNPTPTVIVPDGTSATVYTNGTTEVPSEQSANTINFLMGDRGNVPAPTEPIIAYPHSDKVETVETPMGKLQLVAASGGSGPVGPKIEQNATLPDGSKLNVVSVGGAVAGPNVPMPKNIVVPDGAPTTFGLLATKPENRGTDRAAAVASILDARKLAIEGGQKPNEANKLNPIPPVGNIKPPVNPIVLAKKLVRPHPMNAAALAKKRMAMLVSSGMCASAADAERCAEFTRRINEKSGGLKVA